ncbi:hypothetical protein DWV63_04855 [Enterococcus durans]|nr:hypothetical protein DWV63_04855 [Enterococcus durans]
MRREICDISEYEDCLNRKRLGQKCLTPRNKKKLTKITFQIFVNFGLFKKECFCSHRLSVFKE